GDDSALDATALAGWSLFASAALDAARTAFEKVVAARPGDLASWEGLRACAERTGDVPLRIRAASELGTRCLDDRRAAKFWEEAALLSLELGDQGTTDRALEESFARDAGRPVAFQKLFWEQARVLREGGDQEAALKALEHVTMLDPDHVGALALLGEINIRRGN